MMKLNSKNVLVNYLIKSVYDLEDIDHIEAFLKDHDTLKLSMKKNGLYSAAEYAPPESGMTNTWVRDTVMITNYLREIGRYNTAQKTMEALRDYFFKHKQRFINIIEGKKNKNDPMQRPHVRFNGDTLEEIEEYWNHAQNDALGYILWMAFKLANLGVYTFKSIDFKVFALFPFYFDSIRYWEDEDSGHWEEKPKVESSSIGVVVAALREMKKFIKNKKKSDFIFNNKAVTITQLETLIKAGISQLDKFLPDESPGTRGPDAALLFLVYPLEVVTKDQETKILESVLSKLKACFGIKRYKGDSYFCADYNHNQTEAVKGEMQNKRDRLFKPGTEAQWCIFDPVVSVIYARKYLNEEVRSAGKGGLLKDSDDFLKYQTHYFNRSLMQLTHDAKCPECYYLKNFSKGIYVPNPHTPLAWTQANLGTALEYMNKSVRLKKKLEQSLNI